MRCPRCQQPVERTLASCPNCGLRVQRNVSGVMKTSAVLIASGEENGFYRSIQEVPEPLRTRLKQSTNGANAGTILIADRAGKERITEAIARREARRRAASAASSETALQTDARPRAQRLKWIVMIIVLALTAAIAAIFGVHW